jgi:exopolysaccharide production protein ExoZ
MGFLGWVNLLFPDVVNFLSDSGAFKSDMDRIYLFGIPSAFLIFGALNLPVAVPRLLVYLGDASYSLYLVHGTVLSFLIKIVLTLNQGTLFGSFAGAITLFVCTVIISCSFYSVIEKNLLQFLRKALKK